MSSTIVISKNGTPITGYVILSSAQFAAQMAAVPGSFSFTCKDPNDELSFITGDEITLTVDGSLLFGGYLTQVGRTYAFPADDVSALPYAHRFWNLRGVDFNILFDKRVVRNTANYLEHIQYTNQHQDGWQLTNLMDNYIDMPAGFDTSTYVEDLLYLLNSYTGPDSTKGYWEQGKTLRDVFKLISKISGAVWYIDAAKNVHYQGLESVEKRWGLSDEPNNNTITTSPAEYQGATIGFREMEAVEDGSVLVNDALVWGGAEFNPDAIVFARIQDEVADTTTTSATYIQDGAVISGSSIDLHGRWQKSETHFDSDHGTRKTVRVRANLIVNGAPGVGVRTENTDKGLRLPQWSISMTWFASDVPLLSGTPDHIRPGDLVTTVMTSFSEDGGTTPFVKQLPCRSIDISFPTGTADGKTEVQFRGTFGLQMDDPQWYWTYILAAQDRVTETAATPPPVSDGDTETSYGAVGDFTPTPATDGVTTLFSIPFGYIPGSLDVTINGLYQRRDTDYFETDPINGTFTMTSAPYTTDTLHAYCRTLSS